MSISLGTAVGKTRSIGCYRWLQCTRAFGCIFNPLLHAYSTAFSHQTSYFRICSIMQTGLPVPNRTEHFRTESPPRSEFSSASRTESRGECTVWYDSVRIAHSAIMSRSTHRTACSASSRSLFCMEIIRNFQSTRRVNVGLYKTYMPSW